MTRANGMLGTCALLSCLVFTLVLACGVQRATADAQVKLEFRDFEAATKSAAAQGKHHVLFFGAEWCKWCRKMAAVGLHDAGVLKAGQAYVWSKIDIDEHPELAARYEVRGVPALRIVNADGEVVAGRDGYLPAATLQSFLSEQRAGADPASTAHAHRTALGARLAAIRSWKPAQVPRAELERVLDQLASSRSANAELIRALTDVGPTIAPALVAALDSKRLATRAAAHQLLLQTTAAKLPFDPFAPEATRKSQAQGWAAWVEQPR